MKLENEFSVRAALDRTWATLLDIERVAKCLPGARLEPNGSDGIYRGEIQLKLGPMTLSYKGTARLAEVEEDEHSATIEARAREVKGTGTATARIRNHLTPGDNGSTRVKVETDLSVTGRPAQFGRGIMEDVASQMLTDFAHRLEREILAGDAPAGARAAADAPAVEGEPAFPRAGAAPGAAPPGQAPEPQPEGESLDVGAILLAPLAKRAPLALGVMGLVGLLLLLLAARRRRGLTVTVTWR